MRLITASDVLKLTGLSADQLREWTTRRGLFRPDAMPNGPGSRARYAWQTVLLLRIAVALKKEFHVELEAHRRGFHDLGRKLAKSPFPALRGTAVVIRSEGDIHILPLRDARMAGGDTLLLELDPHLDALSKGFSLSDPVRQLPLFTAVAVK